MISLNKFPVHFYFGLVLILIIWFFNWYLTGLRTHLLFFPLWLGYSLTIDGIVWRRKGSSLISRDLKKYLGLFVISIPTWWAFELLNKITNNWEYLGRESFTDLEYFIYASISFSTVIPAVFGSAELASTFKWMNNIGKGPKIPSSKKSIVLLIFIGGITMALLVIWPSYFLYLSLVIYFFYNGFSESYFWL